MAVALYTITRQFVFAILLLGLASLGTCSGHELNSSYDTLASQHTHQCHELVLPTLKHFLQLGESL